MIRTISAPSFAGSRTSGASAAAAAAPAAEQTRKSGFAAAPPASNVHLAYLDGLRGLAALYVTLSHIFQFLYTGIAVEATPRWLSALTSLLKFGTYAVCVFIVLSGCCLMLPVVRSASGDGSLKGGVSGFLARRSRRILPPYYAGLLLSLLLILAVPSLRHAGGTQWNVALPALTPQSLISHALLVHNLIPQCSWSINPPLWTVALEWQIYFLFALVLLPLWRRAGTVATVAAGAVIGLMPVLLGAAYAYTWFVGLFALGMAAAVMSFQPASDGHAKDARCFPFSAAAGVLSLVVLAVSVYADHRYHGLGVWETILLDAAFGVATALFLIGHTSSLRDGRDRSLAGTLLSHPAVAGLGRFSYSLYLIHYPLLAAFYLNLLRLHLSQTANFAVLTLVFLPGVLTIAYLFYLVFERPFLRSPKAVAVPGAAVPSSVAVPSAMTTDPAA